MPFLLALTSLACLKSGSIPICSLRRSNLLQEALDDGLLGLLPRKSEGLKLYKLLSCYLAYGSLVYQLCIRMIRIQCRDCKHLGLSRYDGVALRMSMAGSLACYIGIKYYPGIFSCNGTADQVCRGVLSYKLCIHAGLRILPLPSFPSLWNLCPLSGWTPSQG